MSILFRSFSFSAGILCHRLFPMLLSHHCPALIRLFETRHQPPTYTPSLHPICFFIFVLAHIILASVFGRDDWVYPAHCIYHNNPAFSHCGKLFNPCTPPSQA